MIKTKSVLHAGNCGDVWAALPAMRELYRKTKKKIIVYLQENVVTTYYLGAVHPTIDQNGNSVMLNSGMINMMIPLLKEQPYIADAKVWDGELIDVDFNIIRATFVNMPNHSLSRWYFYVFPDLQCDLSEKWLRVPKTDVDFAKGKLIIARSERYLNPVIKYNFLKKYESKLIFAGTELEHIIFNARYGLNIPRLVINNFLELAQAVNQSLGLVSNQTQIFQIAEGLKHPRCVELCSFAPNVEPIGKKAFEFYAQEALEYHVKTLLCEEQKPAYSGFPVAPKLSLPK